MAFQPVASFIDEGIFFLLPIEKNMSMGMNSKKQTAVSVLWGISAAIYAVTAIITGVSGDYGLAAVALCMMSSAILAMGFFMKSDGSQCSEKNAEMTLE